MGAGSWQRVRRVAGVPVVLLTAVVGVAVVALQLGAPEEPRFAPAQRSLAVEVADAVAEGAYGRVAAWLAQEVSSGVSASEFEAELRTEIVRRGVPDRLPQLAPESSSVPLAKRVELLARFESGAATGLLSGSPSSARFAADLLETALTGDVDPRWRSLIEPPLSRVTVPALTAALQQPLFESIVDRVAGEGSQPLSDRAQRWFAFLAFEGWDRLLDGLRRGCALPDRNLAPRSRKYHGGQRAAGGRSRGSGRWYCVGS